jgi:hypothetical protein
VRRHLADHDAARSDARALADVDRAEDARVGADDDVGRKLRVTHVARERGAAQNDALVQEAPVAHRRRLADHDTHAVIDDDAPPERRARMDLDAGDEPVDVREDARNKARIAQPQRVRQAVKPDRVQARVDEEHLEPRSRGGVVGNHRGDVLGRELEAACELAQPSQGPDREHRHRGD